MDNEKYKYTLKLFLKPIFNTILSLKNCMAIELFVYAFHKSWETRAKVPGWKKTWPSNGCSGKSELLSEAPK